jgi:hypothetical protein
LLIFLLFFFFLFFFFLLLSRYYGAPDQKQEWSVTNLEKHPKVPCCTVLIRILPAAKSEDGTKILSQNDAGVDASQYEGEFCFFSLLSSLFSLSLFSFLFSNIYIFR